MSVLEMRGVGRTYGRGEATVHALADLDLDVDAGELVAVMGPSGSGKSTLLGLAGGIDTPTVGEITVAGTSLTGLGRAGLARMRRRTIGFVFQEFNLVPTLTAAENVALPLELDGASPRTARRDATALLERLDLAELGDRYVEQMSGGQRQRVAIARAVVGERKLVLADEPTGALDSATGDDVMALLSSVAEGGVAVVVVTHEARHAAWADRVVFLRDGRRVDQTQTETDPASLLVPRRQS